MSKVKHQGYESPDIDSVEYTDTEEVLSKKVIVPEFVDASTTESLESPQPEENEMQQCKDEMKSPVYFSSGHRSQDEDDLFGQTIAAELKRIPSSKKKMKIKADMYRLLYENESD